MKILQTEIPDQLYNQTTALVKEGWFLNEQEIFQEALRRFVDAHRMTLMEKYIRDDVEWGLHGND